MKKWGLFLLLWCGILGGNAYSNDLGRTFYADTVSGADTNAARSDFIYTESMDMSFFERVWLSINIESTGNDTLFANDTFFVFLQSSPDNKNWTDHGLDTLIAIKKGENDTLLNIPTGIDRDSSFMANWGRVKVLHRNTLSSEQALDGNIYTKFITAWVSYIKTGGEN